MLSSQNICVDQNNSVRPVWHCKIVLFSLFISEETKTMRLLWLTPIIFLLLPCCIWPLLPTDFDYSDYETTDTPTTSFDFSDWLFDYLDISKWSLFVDRVPACPSPWMHLYASHRSRCLQCKPLPQWRQLHYNVPLGIQVCLCGALHGQEVSKR